MLAASSLFAVGALAKDAPPAADPKAVELIREHRARRESPPRCATSQGWRTPQRIVMATQNPNGTGTQEIRATLEGVAPGVEIVFVADADGRIKEAANADAIIGGDDVACDERVLAAAKRVRWVAVMSAGVEACLGKPALERPGSDRDQHARGRGPRDGRAHHRADVRAVAFIAGVGGPAGDRRGLEPQFRGLTTTVTDRQDLLVAGLGGIGLEVAKRAHALGMKVIGTRNSSREGPDYVSHVGLSDELPTHDR